MILQVEYQHVQQHEAADSAFSSLVKAISLFKKDLHYEVKRAKLREVDLHWQGADQSFVAVFAIEADVSLQSCLCIFDLQDGNNTFYPLNVDCPFSVEQNLLNFGKQDWELFRLFVN